MAIQKRLVVDSVTKAMNDGPRVIAGNEKFRIVRTVDATYVVEKYEGTDAMGADRWRDLKFGEADSTARLLRDYIIASYTKGVIFEH